MATTAIFAAVHEGHLEALKRLLAQDPALAQARNPEGSSVILAARYRFRLDMVEALLDAHPALDIFEAAALGEMDRVVELVNSGPELVAAYSADGFTPLHLAAFFGHLEAARALLERGADVRAITRNLLANMPLHAAAAGRHLAICELLLEHGAQVNARQQGRFTPLHAAAQNGDPALVELFLAHGQTSRRKRMTGAPRGPSPRRVATLPLPAFFEAQARRKYPSSLGWLVRGSGGMLDYALYIRKKGWGSAPRPPGPYNAQAPLRPTAKGTRRCT